MKSIKLTEDHKSKLLEMCKELFPKSKIQFTDDFYSEWSLFLITKDDDDETSIEDRIEIHWFEFCMTHLFYKLYDNGWRKENPNCVTDFHLDLHNFKYHPIDYLYKKFKELN